MTDVTVVIPTRGRASYLREALGSVAAEPDVEVEAIVVENGSRELDRRSLRRARLIQLGPVGRSVARNVGAEAADSEFVAFLDSDDLVRPGRFRREVAALEAASAMVLAFGPAEAIDEDSSGLEDETAVERARFEALLARGLTYGSLLVDCPIYTSTTMVRRDAFLAAGGYDVRMDGYEDLDLYLRLALDGRLTACPGDAVACHRRHAGNTPSNQLYACAFRLAEKHLALADGLARPLLLERSVDSLWGLGDVRGARAAAIAAVVEEPRLLARRRFLKRVLASYLPEAALGALRRR